ncbi:SANT/Myb_domain [Hexamita inflata]|uniref:SANT/Myb domain n=1 Tax=Hexamita inflata TaxID=28002 RepID=A0AA86PRK1_9EUKA|nr:SANT/Myb domain [Hexamita inflata]
MTLCHNLLIENYNTLQQIHYYVHNINKLKSSTVRLYRDRWTNDEDILLENALDLLGSNLNVISAVIVSKSPIQIYFRMRYLKDKNANFFIPKMNKRSRKNK